MDIQTTSSKTRLSATWLLGISGASAIAFCILAALVTSGVTIPFDESVLLWINQYASPVFDSFFIFIANLGGVLFVSLVALALTGYWLYKRHFKKALFVALAIGVPALLSVLLKLVFDRPRPDLWEWLIVETSHSFPSGHATASMALALCCVALVWRTKWRVPASIFAGIYVVLIGTSRLYLGVHYPTDILGGWLLSIACVTLITYCIFASRGRKAQS